MSQEQLAVIVVASVAVLCGVTCLFLGAARQHDRAAMINDRATVVNNAGAALAEQANEQMARNDILLKMQSDQLKQWQAVIDRFESLLDRWEKLDKPSDQH